MTPWMRKDRGEVSAGQERALHQTYHIRLRKERHLVNGDRNLLIALHLKLIEEVIKVED